MKLLSWLTVLLGAGLAQAAPLTIDSTTLSDFKVSEKYTDKYPGLICGDNGGDTVVTVFLKFKTGKTLNVKLGSYGNCLPSGNVDSSSVEQDTLSLNRIVTNQVSAAGEGVCTKTIAILDLDNNNLDFDTEAAKCP